MACIWIGFAAAGIGVGFRRELLQADAAPPPASPVWPRPCAGPGCWWCCSIGCPCSSGCNTRRSSNRRAPRARRHAGPGRRILAAQPPAEAILVSNDRNEIVPLFYLQQVEGRAQGYTGLFPRMAPDARFADIGSTVATALAAGAGQPVLLIKSMPGLEARFELAPLTAPLVEVRGSGRHPGAWCSRRPALRPLLLRGYDWTPTPGRGANRPPLAGDRAAPRGLHDDGAALRRTGRQSGPGRPPPRRRLLSDLAVEAG